MVETCTPYGCELVVAFGFLWGLGTALVLILISRHPKVRNPE